jgi:hypothetical protein
MVYENVAVVLRVSTFFHRPQGGIKLRKLQKMAICVIDVQFFFLITTATAPATAPATTPTHQPTHPHHNFGPIYGFRTLLLLVMKQIILIFFSVTDMTYKPRPPIIEGKKPLTIYYVLPNVYQLCVSYY